MLFQPWLPKIKQTDHRRNYNMDTPFSHIIQGRCFFAYAFPRYGLPVISNQPLMGQVTGETLCISHMRDLAFYFLSFDLEPIQIGIFSIESESTPFREVYQLINLGSPSRLIAGGVSPGTQITPLGVMGAMNPFGVHLPCGLITEGVISHKRTNPAEIELPGYQHIGLYTLSDYTIEDHHCIRNYPIDATQKRACIDISCHPLSPSKAQEIAKRNLFRIPPSEAETPVHYISNPYIRIPAHLVFM